MLKSSESHEKPVRPKGSKDSNLPHPKPGSRDSAQKGNNANQSKKVIKKISTLRRRNHHRSPSKNSTQEDTPDDGIEGGKKRGKEKKKVSVTLEPTDVVNSSTNAYVIKRKLGEGGFGAVFQVKAKTKPKGQKTKAFALKMEHRQTHGRLKIEVAVLTALQGLEDEKTRERFAVMIDRGQTNDFYFIIMTLVGPSLETIRDKILLKEYSPSTAYRIALESLESIRHLHVDVGYLHRDLKPSNFTIGSGKNYTKIILIDFGIARQIFRNNVVRLPRKEVKFLGTIRYASRRCHRKEEQGRQGDLESWFYMICDIYNQAVLPWRRVKEKDLVLALKNDLRENNGNNRCLNEQLPKEFRELMFTIDKLEYEDTPNYQALQSLLLSSAKRINVDVTAKWDWETFGPPPPQDSDEDDS